MSLELLDKTRKINHLLINQQSDKVDFIDFCKVLSDELNVNVLLVSRKGKILGHKEKKHIEPISQFRNARRGGYIDEAIQSRLMSVLSTKENANLLTLGFDAANSDTYQVMISPVCMAGKRLGTLFVYRQKPAFSIDDIILTEYGTTVIGLAMQSAESEESSEEHHREQDVQAALKTLSRLEAQAMVYVLNELDGEKKGILVASRLADKVGITRSVIVNALKKCESAGLIETKSSGMKGTNISIMNDLFSCSAIESSLQLYSN